jgi:NTE family protein
MAAGYGNASALRGGVEAWKETFGVPASRGEGKKYVNLALQGGGAHGAFTWGVLDRLLADERIVIEGISGTSAGAMNGVVLAHGVMVNGRDGARKALYDFWKAISEVALFSPFKRAPWEVLSEDWNLDDSPAYLAFDIMTRMFSPYQLNPWDINPLRDILTSLVDFDRVCDCEEIKLFVSATRVRDGQVEVFNRKRLTPDMVMASACIPYLYQAVEVDGEDYWDGGYMGNPVLFPFAYRCSCNDVIIVQVNPLECLQTPKSAREILNRLNEITFNSSLLQELWSIDFIGRLLDEGSLDASRYRKMLLHLISGEEELRAFNASSKMNPEWAFFTTLHDIGWRKSEAWLERHFDSLGRESTLDLGAMFKERTL